MLRTLLIRCRLKFNIQDSGCACMSGHSFKRTIRNVREKHTNVHEKSSADIFPGLSNRYSESYNEMYANISDDEMAKAFIWTLTHDQRHILFKHLHEFEDPAHHTSVPIALLSRSVLRSIFLLKCLPFIAFGFLDNLIMIIAGEYIDLMFGTVLGISTMAAAALGNCVSDIAGCGSASYIERMCSKLGVKAPALTALQINSRQIRWTSLSGKAFGVTVGCLLGMFPLLFFEDKKGDVTHNDNQDK